MAGPEKIRKRNGAIVDFDRMKIQTAVKKAAFETTGSEKPYSELVTAESEYSGGCAAGECVF